MGAVLSEGAAGAASIFFGDVVLEDPIFRSSVSKKSRYSHVNAIRQLNMRRLSTVINFPKILFLGEGFFFIKASELGGEDLLGVLLTALKG